MTGDRTRIKTRQSVDVHWIWIEVFICSFLDLDSSTESLMGGNSMMGIES